MTKSAWLVQLLKVAAIYALTISYAGLPSGRNLLQIPLWFYLYALLPVVLLLFPLNAERLGTNSKRLVLLDVLLAILTYNLIICLVFYGPSAINSKVGLGDTMLTFLEIWLAMSLFWFTGMVLYKKLTI